MKVSNMQQKELKQLKDSGKVISVGAIDRGIHWNVSVHTADENFTIIRTARGGQREFKTLDAVKAMLAEVNIKSFEVCYA